MNGWLAMVWASFAVAPLKRCIIEFPFVAEKAIPAPRVSAAGRLMPCIRNIVYRRRVGARLTPSLLASAGRSLWYWTSS
ncbi:hypothetical protein PO883_07725 [Massilia sp. DJPM01]|uniref:hypothetical protein n=1 Tax=Massilia sp. DJPM01 TaxID=3024404 RepID=UPI00259E5BDF|nr:hypothetical protein [Massilia sp. DJPM01]MDM5177083.1 hypothetical protein [Massilia sp. DJPM01]